MDERDAVDRAVTSPRVGPFMGAGPLERPKPDPGALERPELRVFGRPEPGAFE